MHPDVAIAHPCHPGERSAADSLASACRNSSLREESLVARSIAVHEQRNGEEAEEGGGVSKREEGAEGEAGRAGVGGRAAQAKQLSAPLAAEWEGVSSAAPQEALRQSRREETQSPARCEKGGSEGAREEEPEREEGAGYADVRVLVAEDNLVNQMVLRRILARLGVRHDVVADGAQAVKAWSSKHYDLILMVSEGRIGCTAE